MDAEPYIPKGAFFAALELKQAATDTKPAFDPGLSADKIAHYQLFLALRPA
jgi:hypothetical protein